MQACSLFPRVSILHSGTGQAQKIHPLLSKKPVTLEREITCLLWNARSLQNKIDSFTALLEDADIEVAAVTETWFASQHNNSTAIIRDKGYYISHFNRDDRRGGGVALIYKNTFKLVKTKTYSFETFECILVSISSHDSHSSTQQLNFIVVYRYSELPPAPFLSEFYSFIDSIFIDFKNFIILGDFNLHVNDSFDPAIEKFNDILSTFELNQLVENTTHSKGNILDLIITNLNEMKIKDIHIDFNNESDHAHIFFNLPYAPAESSSKTIIVNDFKNVNIDSFKLDIAAKTENYISNVDGASFSDALNNFNVLCNTIVGKHVDTKRVTLRDSSRPKWMDSEFIKSRAERRKLYKRWVRTRDPDDRLNFKNARTNTHRLSIEKQSQFYAKTIENCNNSHKELFSVCNNLLDVSKATKLPTYTCPEAMATKFNHYFIDKIEKIRSSFDIEPIKPSGTGMDTYIGPVFSEFQPVSTEELAKVIQSKPIKTSQQDPLPAKLFKHCVDELLPALTHLVNLSLSTGSMDGLKDSVITPILKKAGIDPVCNILYLSKLIERTALIQCNNHLDFIEAHIPNQSGYKPKHSCETLLLRVTNDILVNMDNSKCTIKLLLDLSAAFDTVDHSILLHILWSELGFRGNVLQWFVEFLGGRRQAVNVDGSKSSFEENNYGVPQGSVLGPFLFNIYIRNFIKMMEEMGFVAHGYADDHQILFSFQIDFQVAAIRNTIPRCLDFIASWMKKHFLKLNPTKSQVIVFHPGGNHGQIVFDSLMLSDGSYINISSKVHNLGAILDSTLSFSPFITSSVAQGYHLLRNLSGIRKYLSKDDLRTLVNSIVIAKVDNCNSLLYGISAHDSDKLRKFQNSCARLIYHKRKHDHVTSILKELHWLPTEARIYFKLLCYVFKCLHDLAPSYLAELVVIRRNRNLELVVPRTKSRAGDRAFSCAGPRLWNALPVSIRMVESLDSFKSHLKHLFFSSFTQYKCKLNIYKG